MAAIKLIFMHQVIKLQLIKHTTKFQSELQMIIPNDNLQDENQVILVNILLFLSNQMLIFIIILQQFRFLQQMEYTNSAEESNFTLFTKPLPNNNIQTLTNSGDHHSQPTKEFQKNIENGYEVKFYFQRTLMFDKILMITTTISMGLTILYSDADFINDNSNTQICLYMLFAILPISFVTTIFRYKAQVELEISEVEISKFQTLLSSSKDSLILQLIILLCQPYPFLNDIYFTTSDIRDSYTFQFKLNHLLVIFGFMRLFIIARVFLLNTQYMSPRANRVCRLYQAKSDYLYAIKCLFKDVPMGLIGVVFIASILIFALGIRIAERNLKYLDHIYNVSYSQDLQSFSNALWLTIITMTTLGYGDFYPRTLIGRIIVVVLIIWGIFIVSLMVVVLTNTLNMDLSQKRALTVLNRLDLKVIQKKHSVNYIINAWRRQKKIRQQRKLIKQGCSDGQQLQKIQKEIAMYSSKLHLYSKQFKQNERVMQSMFETDDLYENMTRQFQNLMDEIQELIEEQNKTEGNLRQFIQNKKRNKK